MALRDHGRQGHVLLGGQRGEQVEELEDEPDVVAAELGELLVVESLVVEAANRDRARGGRLERADDMEQRALAGSGRAHDRDHLALFDRQVDAVQSAHLGAALAVVHVQVVRLDSCGGHEVNLRLAGASAIRARPGMEPVVSRSPTAGAHPSAAVDDNDPHRASKARRPASDKYGESSVTNSSRQRAPNGSIGV